MLGLDTAPVLKPVHSYNGLTRLYSRCVLISDYLFVCLNLILIEINYSSSKGKSRSEFIIMNIVCRPKARCRVDGSHRMNMMDSGHRVDNIDCRTY